MKEPEALNDESSLTGPKCLPVGVLILAKDEEINLPDCLHSVEGWAEQVAVIVDPRTSDDTRRVAEVSGAELHEHTFGGFAAQKNWALENVHWRTPWVLILDADERVAPELWSEISKALSSAGPEVAFAMRFRFIFYGRWIRHCWHSTWIIRLFRLGKARYESRGVHEHMVVDGKLGYLRGDLIHNDFKGMDDWISKHNHYASHEAEAILSAPRTDGLNGRLFGTRLQRRRFLKEKVWIRLPFRPFFMFMYLYIIKLGILDGALGFRFCLMHAIFEAFTTAKVWEARMLARGSIRNYYIDHVKGYLKRHPEEESRYRWVQ